jgi:hypothetical protein
MRIVFVKNSVVAPKTTDFGGGFAPCKGKVVFRNGKRIELLDTYLAICPNANTNCPLADTISP